MKKGHITFPLVFLILICFFATSGSAAGIKERMRQRLPVIVSLKSQGVIGENNKGFLEYRTSQQSQQGVVNAENKDRGLVYAAIAKRQNVSPVIVGKRRALQIAQNASPGVWLQDPNGKWYRK